MIATLLLMIASAEPTTLDVVAAVKGGANTETKIVSALKTPHNASTREVRRAITKAVKEGKLYTVQRSRWYLSTTYAVK